MVDDGKPPEEMFSLTKSAITNLRRRLAFAGGEVVRLREENEALSAALDRWTGRQRYE
jgi:hypothetical protein